MFSVNIFHPLNSRIQKFHFPIVGSTLKCI